MPPGGAGDVVARYIAEKLTASLFVASEIEKLDRIVKETGVQGE
jgi:hypothetical protein